ncbi:hypothetical protein BS78_02G137900 [Paspalum vaginatum]|nr:hypothetical protein BS78_02G137900 [Paspalum vaginatum]
MGIALKQARIQGHTSLIPDKIAQLAISLPNANVRKEQKKKITEPEEKDDTKSTPGAEEKTTPKTLPHEFYDTTVLPFPPHNEKAAADEQYSKFVEVIKKLYVNIPLLDSMQVPTYAKYMKDILNNKKPLPSTEIVHMTEECSVAILNQPPQKKKDPESPTIPCSIGNQVFNQTLCDLGASVSVMPKVVFDKLNHIALAPTTMCLQLADQSIRHPAGIAEDVPVKIRNFLIPVDFVVLDMEIDEKTSLIFGQPFLCIVDASIDVRAGEVHLNINGMRETFIFKPKVEKCNHVKTFRCQPQRYMPKTYTHEDVSEKKMDSLITHLKSDQEAAIQQKEESERREAKLKKASSKAQETGGKAPGKMVDAGMQVLTTKERRTKYYKRNPAYLHPLDILKGRVWKILANR